MRCYCCNKMLSDFEATRKSIKTNEYLDMCNKCYATISDDLLTYERNDLYDEHEDNEEGEYLSESDHAIYLDRGVDNHS